MKDLLNGYRQHEPFLIEIEPTEGCNLGCSFCGLRGIREKGTGPQNFMTLETAELIANRIKESGWNSRITFCGHGEPTMNKDLLEIIKIFRKILPKHNMSLLCNGYGFKHGLFNIRTFLQELERIQFNSFALDVYSDKGDWTAIEDAPEYMERVVIIGKDGEGFNYTKRTPMRIALYPMEVDASIYRSLSNHCGAAAPLDYARKEIRCTKPFRELFIRWNGFVALCCDDFRGQYKIGFIKDFKKIDDLWNSPAFQSIRIMLYNGKRTVKPCLGCSCPPIRAGFLPDPSGRDKEAMPEITADVIKECKKYYDEKGSTTIVKRKWEK